MTRVSEKTRRQRTILEALRDESVGSQEALAAALKRRGLDATQATLSRDLHELRIVRTPTEDGYRYIRAGDGAPAGNPGGARLRSVTAEEVTGVDANEVAVVVRTLTGRAQGAGVFLDGLRLPEVLGTIAGDDTLLVIPRSIRSAGRLKTILARLFGIDGAERRGRPGLGRANETQGCVMRGERMKKYVLAYSGGLDTSVILKWLKVNHHVDVVTVTADLGQKGELEGLREKAMATGASHVFIDDLRDEFVAGYVWPSLAAGALYQGVYPMATALGRPLIAKRLVEVAREVGADAVVHGCTGKGNDQVRLEVSVAALAPELRCIAPLRDWELKTREDEIAWAREHDVPVAATRKSPYSIDGNLWGIAVECGALEDPWAAPPDDCWQITTDPRTAPDEAEEITVAFESGVPVALDGVGMDGPALLDRLNRIAAAHGVGRLDMVEDRLVGIKSREVYEAPAALTLHTAREALEQITLDRETRRLKTDLGQQLARLVYDGLWFSPLRDAIEAFVREACTRVTGEVRLSLSKGKAVAVGRRSPWSLYDHRLATYGDGDAFHHQSAPGFIDLFGLGVRTANAVARREHRLPSAIASERAR